MKVYQYNGKWMADAGMSPATRKRERKLCDTKAEAQQWLISTKTNRLQEGSAILTTEQRLDAVVALKALGGRATLAQAAKFYMDRVVDAPLASVALRGFYAAKQGLNRRPETLKELENKISSFIGEVGDKRMDEYTSGDGDIFLSRFKPLSRNQYLTVVRGFFNWAMRRGMINENPLANIEKASVEIPPPHIHTHDEVAAVLNAAASIDLAMLPWYVLGYYCGIRMAELGCITWGDINLGAKPSVFVSPAVAKKRRQRHVAIPDNAAAWIRLAKQDIGKLRMSVHSHRKIVKQSKVKWSRNVMRHSFGSYHLARHQNAAETAMMMGHTDTRVVYAHYRNPVLHESACAYFEVWPNAQGQSAQSLAASG